MLYILNEIIVSARLKRQRVRSLLFISISTPSKGSRMAISILYFLSDYIFERFGCFFHPVFQSVLFATVICIHYRLSVYGAFSEMMMMMTNKFHSIWDKNMNHIPDVGWFSISMPSFIQSWFYSHYLYAYNIRVCHGEKKGGRNTSRISHIWTLYLRERKSTMYVRWNSSV